MDLSLCFQETLSTFQSYKTEGLKSMIFFTTMELVCGRMLFDLRFHSLHQKTISLAIAGSLELLKEMSGIISNRSCPTEGK